MKICVISGSKGMPDEGMRNFASHVSDLLSRNHEVMHVSVKQYILSVTFWANLKKFDPDIIHLFLRPNPFTFALLKVIGHACGNAKLVASALQPPENQVLLRHLMPYLKPDIVLVQSDETNTIFNMMGIETRFISSGVDCEKFCPVDSNRKEELRRRYGFDKNASIVLHVGHINKGRNLEIFKSIARQDGVQVLIVGSTNEFNFDGSVYADLVSAGCHVKREYIEHIEEVYQLSDCYVFPTCDRSYAIEVPLSVLEAMSCNIPVISTKYGGLIKIFGDNSAIHFVESIDEISDVLRNVKENLNYSKSPRSFVLGTTWTNVADNIGIIYRGLIPEVS